MQALAKIHYILLLVVLGVSQYTLTVSLRALDTMWVEPPDAQDAKWNPALFKFLTFGHLPSAVDWLWVRAHQDPAYNHVARGSHPPAYFDFDLATDLDPMFFEAYASGATTVAVIRDDGEGARDLLLKGDRFRKQELPKLSPEFRAAYWKREWDIPLLLAYVYLFELNDLPKAAQQFRECSIVPGAPPYLVSLARRLEAPGGIFDVGANLLNHNLHGTQDEAVREQLRRKLVSLEVVRFLHLVRAKFDESLSQRRARLREAPDRRASWARFAATGGARDPWGGQLSMDANGRIVTSTPHEKVLGLD